MIGSRERERERDRELGEEELSESMLYNEIIFYSFEIVKKTQQKINMWLWYVALVADRNNKVNVWETARNVKILLVYFFSES